MPSRRAPLRVSSTWAGAMAGLTLALVLLGPGLGPGALLNLDLVATANWPSPRSLWGLGPELPRALPFEIGVSASAAVIGGAATVKLFYVGAITMAFVGMRQMVRRLGLSETHAWLSATLYATSPFLLTRMGVGHLTMVGATAILPYVQPRLLLPSESGRKTFLAAAALATMGFYGGILAGVCVGAGLAHESHRRLRVALGALIWSQLVWFVPGLILLAQGPSFGSSLRFPSGLTGWLGPFRLVTGHGFWQDVLQVGGDSDAVVIVAASVMAAAAVAASGYVSPTWLRPAGTAAVLGALLMFADAVPGLNSIYAELTELPGLGALREPQRIFPLVGIVLAVMVPVGASQLAGMAPAAWRTAIKLAPLGLAALLVAPAVWGLDGQLQPVDIPDEWAEARSVTRVDPGPIMVLPWHRYQNVSIAEERRVLNPAIQYFGPEVVTSTDLELGGPSKEAIDAREDHLKLLLPKIRAGEPVAEDLADSGIRWVLIFHDVDYESYLPILRDPGLEPVFANIYLDLLEVTAWTGPVVSVNAVAVGVDRPAAPFVILDQATDGVWSEPFAPGWMQGFSRVSESPTGLVELPGGSRIVWYWPSLLVLGAYGVWVGGLIRAWDVIHRRNR